MSLNLYHESFLSSLDLFLEYLLSRSDLVIGLYRMEK
jgi:hypothetical protein